MVLTPKNYAEVISKLTHEDRLSFYESLSHKLTIVCRSLWLNDELSKDEKILSMKWLNEILHRIIAKTRVERLGNHQWKEEDIIDMISGYVKQCPILKSEIAWAIKSSYETVSKHKQS